MNNIGNNIGSNTSRGKVTVGYGTHLQREIEISDFVQAKFIDNRIVSISSLEDGSMVATVENIQSTGRNTQSSIWLSKESFIGMLSTAFLYFSCKGEDLGELIKNTVEKNDIEYTYSDNLKPIDSK